MAHEAYYPALDEATIKSLKVMQQLSLEHPGYWLEAPYSGVIQRILEDILKPKKMIHESAPLDRKDDEEEWEFLYRESHDLYTKLKVAGAGLEGNELMSFYKTAASLLEKLLQMQERANNLKQISDFYQVVMDIMETELTSDQRTRVMERLRDQTKG